MARVRQQAAVIPYRIRKERVEVAVVTRSGGKGWIVPKGSVDAGERPRDAAIREAEEEAGLRGVVTPKPLGRYRRVNAAVPAAWTSIRCASRKCSSTGSRTSFGGAAGCAEQRDLQRGGRVLAVLERQGNTFVVAAPSASDDGANLTRAQAQIDNSWAVQILSGQMSPLAALERRVGSPGPPLIEHVRALIGARRLERIDSRWARQGDPERVALHDDRRILVHRTATSRREAVGMSSKFGR